MKLTWLPVALTLICYAGWSQTEVLDIAPEATQFYIVRHGETLRNQAGDRISGQEDGQTAQLNGKGRIQANQLGQKLAEHSSGKIAAIYTSPLGRARETAWIIASHFPHVPVIEDARLMEFNHGKYDTMLLKLRNRICQAKYSAMEQEAARKGEVLDRFFKWRLRWSDLIEYDPAMTETPLEGTPECALEVFERVNAFLEEIDNMWPGATIIVVTHAGIIKTLGLEAESRQRGDKKPLPMYFEPPPESAITTGNCSVTLFEKKKNAPLVFIQSGNL